MRYAGANVSGLRYSVTYDLNKNDGANADTAHRK
jgi:hypothetical protein